MGRVTTRQIVFPMVGYICTVALLFMAFVVFRSSHLDIRTYLASDVAQTLHKYDTVDNHWDGAFLDPTGYAYYENIKSEDLSKLLTLNGEKIWNGRITKYDSASTAQWKHISTDDLGYTEWRYKTKMSHPDTLCSFAAGALCVNKTTGRVLFSYR